MSRVSSKQACCWQRWERAPGVLPNLPSCSAPAAFSSRSQGLNSPELWAGALYTGRREAWPSTTTGSPAPGWPLLSLQQLPSQ